MMIREGVLMSYRQTGPWIFSICIIHAFSQSINTPAPVFSGKTLDGEVISLSDYKGSVVLLDIWASWCGPCKKEMPFLIETDKKYNAQDLVVLAVNIDKNIENVRKFISELETPPAFAVILDNEGAIPALFKIKGMPTTILIDRNGVICYSHTGFKPEKEDEYLEQIRSLLKENPES